MSGVKIFVYGMLQPNHNPPQSMRDPKPDVVKGDLYDMGEYPGALNMGTSWLRIPGFVITIDVDELPKIDRFENVHLGEYRRINVITESGIHVYAYEFAWNLPAGALRIKRWPQ